jgi:hypothetical protein
MQGAFLRCAGNELVECGPGGGETSTTCEAGCSTSLHACNVCEPNTLDCSGDSLERCATDGSGWQVDATCGLGCSTTGTPHCKTIEPTFAPAGACELAAAATATITAGADIDTDVDCDAVIDRAGMPDVCVIHLAEIDLPVGEQIMVRGSRALAVVSYGPIMIEGMIYGAAAWSTPGPGASFAVNGSWGGAAGHIKGGGGGGGRTAGAGGGGNDLGTPFPGGEGGASLAASLDDVLIGGASGGSGPEALLGPEGGAGGGGIALSSCTGAVTVEVQGRIDVSGGGGGGGRNCSIQGARCGGAGGGAGGTLALQGTSITIFGELRSVGGGGGAGKGPFSTGYAGSNGDFIGHGTGGDGNGYRGGSGGDGTSAPGPGQPSGDNDFTAGGGGGSAGRIVFYLPAGSVPSTPGVLHPAPLPLRQLSIE